MRDRKRKIDVDGIIIVVCVVVLMFIGTLFVYSASNYTAEKTYDDKYYFLKKQLIGYAVGIAVFFGVRLIKIDFYKKIAFWACVVSAVLLLLVLTPLGIEVYGAKRWLGFGGVTVQPSDFAKLSFAMFAAAYFSDNMERASSIVKSLPVMFVGGVLCVLVSAEPNMSITVCLAAVLVIMLFVAGFPLNKLLLLALPILVIVPLLIVAEPYGLKRLSAFLDPWSSPKAEGYQLIQSLYAIGSGGLFGCGIFQSRQKYRFLPFAESDFILSVIGEETGFVGVCAVLALCLFLAVHVIGIGKKCGNFFRYLLCVGIGSVFIVQVAVNALVVTGSIPPTGVPFPLVSSGNTQIITFAASFGIVRSISAENTEKSLI